MPKWKRTKTNHHHHHTHTKKKKNPNQGKKAKYLPYLEVWTSSPLLFTIRNFLEVLSTGIGLCASWTRVYKVPNYIEILVNIFEKLLLSTLYI